MLPLSFLAGRRDTREDCAEGSLLSRGKEGILASTVHQFMLAQALHLKAGRIEAVARSYSVPLIVSLPKMDPGFVVIPSRAGVEHFFRLKHAGLKAAGIAHLRVRVLQTRATAPDRITAQVEWYYLTPDGTRAGQTTARYFLARRQGAIRVAMVEFEQVAFPQLADWFREAAEPLEHTPRRRVQ